MKSNRIIQTAEPFFLPGNDRGCLLIHGFTGTPKEMRMLGESLHGKGYSVLAPRLFAHATCPEDMDRAKWQDWLACVEDGYHLLKGCTKSQVLIGLSMGGILALTFAAHNPCAGVITISTPYDVSMDPRSKYLKYVHPFIRKIPKGQSDNKNDQAVRTHIDYPYYPSKAIIELMQLMDEMHASLQRIQAPALLIQSHGDHGIPSYSLEKISQGIASPKKEVFWVNESGHVIIEDIEREQVFSKISAFLSNLS